MLALPEASIVRCPRIIRTDIRGSFRNLYAGTILTTGGATTTFYDDVLHNGGDIRTAAGSFTVFLGSYGGAGSFPGEGLVQFEGPLGLGNSPAVVDFGGDVRLTSSASTTIELGGLFDGQFDAFRIGGNFDIDGLLDVALIDGFQLGLNQSFLIADVTGTLTGSFTGLLEGALVSTHGGQDLFISYTAGDGNDVALYTIPTPGSVMLFCISMALANSPRTRKTTK